MITSFLTMPHVVFGVWGIMTAVWVLVELLNYSEKNLGRLKIASALTTVFNWLAYVIGGWWYVVYYAADKAMIKKGPFPAAHGFFMETKEHVFFILLLLSMLLPVIVYSNKLSESKSIRKLGIVVAIIMVILGFGMEGFGSFITQGLRLGILGGK
ncbi:hypothetical protein [Paradesulfitobacterium ferrireducens]|uniref:hypothetical protein n=1 Tax=Paradesulfitobacterium ferrireducens TaxID=2816476 RepID=UPI001A8CB24F|nr:hypothetical protein [Paradesulfitobacterium ferrireducens]